MITQSTTIVQHGETVDITADVGAFSAIVAKPVITINHKIKKIVPDGQVHYKIPPVKKPGTYFVPVTREYNDGYDKIVQEKRVLKFTVIE